MIEHIRSRGYHVVDAEPDMATGLCYPRICILARRGGYNGVRAPLDSEIARRVLAAVESAHGPVVKLPTRGRESADRADHDENLWNGIETMAALLAME